MKAIVLTGFGGTENFDLREVENPLVKENEVLVKVKAIAFNPIDCQMRKGGTERKLIKSPILGRELSGETVAVGKNVARFKTGDKVAAYVGSLASNGAYAEWISIPEELIARIPDKLSYEEAAALPMVGMTALQCFKRMQVPKDKPVFISGGAGGVGTILIKLLLANGNHEIYTTAGNDDSINHLISIGLKEDTIIDYKQDDVIAALNLKVTNGTFEYVIDLVGGNMSEVCAELIAIYGTYADVTSLTTEKAREALFDKAIVIINIANYAHTFKKEKGSLNYYGNALRELFDKVDNMEITPSSVNVVGKMSVETVKIAHQLMEENKTKGKKLVMEI